MWAKDAASKFRTAFCFEDSVSSSFSIILFVAVKTFEYGAESSSCVSFKQYLKQYWPTTPGSIVWTLVLHVSFDNDIAGQLIFWNRSYVCLFILIFLQSVL